MLPALWSGVDEEYCHRGEGVLGRMVGSAGVGSGEGDGADGMGCGVGRLCSQDVSLQSSWLRGEGPKGLFSYPLGYPCGRFGGECSE